jgi:hypothetical protein
VSAKARRILLVVALAAIAFEPFLFWGSFAGDAQVHLVFAESASRGRFFEFNPGERVSGETSPGYMLLGAVLFRTLPARFVPVGLKVVGLIAWYLFCWLVYRVAVRAWNEPGECDRAWAAAAAVAAALIPGSVYNANVGMENGLFALTIWLWLDLAGRWRWFEPVPGRTLHEASLAALLGLACWLRPEGLIVAALAFVFRFRSAQPPFRRRLAGGTTMAAAIGAASIVFQYAYTGDVIATSILSRRVLATQHALAFGPIMIDPAFAQRLILYAPLTLFFVMGFRRSFAAASDLTRYLLWLLVSFFIFYTLAGGPQLARYIIFIAPILTIGAARGVRMAWRYAGVRGRVLVGLAVACLLVVDLIEPVYRRRQFSQHLLAEAMAAPTLRQQRTDELFSDLGNPARRPIIVACESVQQRYGLDDRVVVRSLDGRTDRSLFLFVHHGTVDQVGYLKREHVDVLIGPTSYDRGSSISELAGLDSLQSGMTKTQGGLLFRRLTSHGFALASAPPEAPGL